MANISSVDSHDNINNAKPWTLIDFYRNIGLVVGGCDDDQNENSDTSSSGSDDICSENDHNLSQMQTGFNEDSLKKNLINTNSGSSLVMPTHDVLFSTVMQSLHALISTLPLKDQERHSRFCSEFRLGLPEQLTKVSEKEIPLPFASLEDVFIIWAIDKWFDTIPEIWQKIAKELDAWKLYQFELDDDPPGWDRSITERMYRGSFLCAERKYEDLLSRYEEILKDGVIYNSQKDTEFLMAAVEVFEDWNMVRHETPA